MKIRSNGLSIAYTDAGKGDTTLLFVHGSFIDKSYWAAQLAHFRRRYRVIAPDLAGHGASGKNRDAWTMKSFAEDIVALVRQLGLEKVVLVCHSLGCDIALEAIALHPEPIIGFVAVDYFKMAGTELPEPFRPQVEKILSDIRTDFSATTEQYARTVLLTAATPEALKDRVVQDYRNAYPPMGIQSLEELFGYALRQRALLQQLPLKLYLINCDYMPTDESALQRYANKGYALDTIHASSHYPMVELPEAFNRLLGEILQEIEAGMHA